MAEKIPFARRPVSSSPSTPHQRLYIRTLMRQLELDTLRITLFLRRFWEAAKLPEPALGTELDAWLCSLTRAQASALVAALKAEVPDDE